MEYGTSGRSIYRTKRQLKNERGITERRLWRIDRD
jgi:hypothetical protein